MVSGSPCRRSHRVAHFEAPANASSHEDEASTSCMQGAPTEFRRCSARTARVHLARNLPVEEKPSQPTARTAPPKSTEKSDPAFHFKMAPGPEGGQQSCWDAGGRFRWDRFRVYGFLRLRRLLLLLLLLVPVHGMCHLYYMYYELLGPPEGVRITKRFRRTPPFLKGS